VTAALAGDLFTGPALLAGLRAFPGAAEPGRNGEGAEGLER
jgi:hypothetical protein